MNLVGHQKIQTMLKNIASGGKFSHAYLFVGPKHSGKSLFANFLGQSLLCREEGAPCAKCFDCRLFEAGNHPDFLVNDSEAAVGVDEIRELIHFLELKPYQAKRKVALITHFERLSIQAANSFLKTLEEPAENTVLIITAENIQNLLPTIVSRSQVVRFQNVGMKEIRDELILCQKVDGELAEKAIAFSGGRIGLAIQLAKAPQRIAETEDFLNRFQQTIKEGGTAERIILAEHLSKDREDLLKKLDMAEIHFHQQLGTEELLKICQILGKIAESKDCLYRNGNPRLIAESLLFEGL
jgi:DNA polymerase-3 subunit delta'